MRGPVLIEAVVDANEPPLPGKIKPTQAKHLAEALQRGEPGRTRVGLTIGHEMLDESTFAASPYGIIGRAAERLTGVGSGDEDGKSKQ